MGIIDIRPLPESYRKISRKFWPCHPPIGVIKTKEDVQLAVELYLLLDYESRTWYYWEGGIFPHPDTGREETKKETSIKSSKGVKE